jgi:predicted 2-oxoglutarate/Fe(II)-dependent dioxygenase YbiX
MIFTEKFLAIDPMKIADAIRTSGFFAMQSAVTSDFLDKIEADVARNRFGLNLNQITGVFAYRQYYLVDMLAVSKAFFDYCTHPAVFAISRELLGPRFRLQSLRYYETFGKHHMQWHTDNKSDRAFAHNPGLIFIIYVSDVTDGEFQYVSGSHIWSGEKNYNDYPDRYIADKFGKDIVGFMLPRGSVIIYNTYGIHRAKPVQEENFLRKSLFFQVDSEINNGERIIVNTAFIDKLDDEIKMYLGFGRPGNYVAYPQTSLQSLPLTHGIVTALFKWAVKKKVKQLVGRA